MTVPKLPPVPLPWRPLTEDEIWASDAIMGENGRRAGLLLLDLVALVRAVEEEIQARFAPPDQSERIATLEKAAEQAREAIEALRSVDVHSALTEDDADAINAKLDNALRAIEEVQHG